MDRSRSRKRIVGLWLLGVVAGLTLVVSGWVLSSGSVAVAGLGLALAVAVALHGKMHRPGAVPVMVWHSVSEDQDWLPWSDNISVRPSVFAAQMRALRRWGWHPVSNEALAEWMTDPAAPLPSRAVVLHFDDGYRDNDLAAVPVLRKLGFPATIFIASDFIAPAPRDDWKGYLSAAELQALDADPLIEIACHGRDHSRMAIAGAPVGTFTAENWRARAELTWAHQPGNKADWFETASPAPFSFGDDIPASDSALTARALTSAGTPESKEAQATRIEADLREARHVLEDILGREVRHICWPFDRTNDVSVTAATQAGFEVMTGGRGYNRKGTPVTVISRTHVTDHALGGGPLWTELLVFRAKLGMSAGNLYWSPVVWGASALRNRRFRRPQSPGQTSVSASSGKARVT
ncbi:MAG: polysaccharide deacetylase family protein [Pseudomonadota bacterium]